MNFGDWIKRVSRSLMVKQVSSQRVRRGGKPRPRVVLGVEQLEDRVTPTVSVVTPVNVVGPNGNSVYSTTANLNVLGSDSIYPESDLTYQWSTLYPSASPAAFSANGTNAAQNTKATFTAASSYEVEATITDPGGATVNSIEWIYVVPTPNPSTVTFGGTANVAPGTVMDGSSQQFLVTSAVDQFNNPIPAYQLSGEYSWSLVSGPGTMSGPGLYTAPGSGTGTVAIQATATGGKPFAPINWTFELASTGPTAAWFSSHLGDPGIEGLASSLYSSSGNALNRADMMQIVNEVVTADGPTGTISSQQIADLRTLVSNGNYLGMTPDVQNLASKVVFFDLANTYRPADPVGFAYPGNLSTSTTGSQLQTLEQMWFLGSNVPRLDTFGNLYASYESVSGPLFNPGGPIPQDVQQGGIGSCYFLASVASLAEHPQAVEDMITNNGDGTYTVRFVRDDVEIAQGGAIVYDYVTVNSELAFLTSASDPIGNRVPGQLYYANDPTGALWVPLLEKAYAQVQADGWTIAAQSRYADNYGSINTGYTVYAEEELSGAQSVYWDGTQASLNADLAAGYLVSGVDSAHAFAIYA